MCTLGRSPAGSLQVDDTVDILSQASDVVRPKLLLEVKAANKVGCAIKRAFSTEGWLAVSQAGSTGRVDSCESANDGFTSIFCSQGGKCSTKAWFSCEKHPLGEGSCRLWAFLWW